MANINRFLKQIVTGDNVRDAQHASRTFIDDQFALQPRHKHLFHVVFNFHDNVQINPDFTMTSMERGSLHLLVKSIDLPQFNIDVEERNQYNRHRNTQHRINYQDVGINFHDDQSDIIRKLWVNYYKYFYEDGNHESKNPGAGTLSNVYSQDDVYSDHPVGSSYWGMDRDPAKSTTGKQFFSSIQIYSIFQKRFVEHTLINPIITSFSHDTHDYSTSDLLEHKMQIKYESVHYAEGSVAEDFPQNFAVHRYDKTPSPLTPLGGGTNSILGQGGILDGASTVMGLFGSGNIVGGLFGAAKVLENSKGTNWKRVLKDEAFQIFKNAGRDKNLLTGTVFMSSKNSRKRNNTKPLHTPPANSNGGKATSQGTIV